MFVPPGGCTGVGANWLLSRISGIELIADPFDEVFETNEGNNSLVQLLATPAPPVVRPRTGHRTPAH
jgi:hypothetical protein